MLRFGLICAAVLLSSPIAISIAAEPDAKPGPSTEPKDLPIELTIVSETNEFYFDGRGEQPAKFQQRIRDMEKYGDPLPATRVQMNLQIKNKGKSTIRIWESGDATLLTLDLKGPDAMTAEAKRKGTGFISPTVVSIAPGKTYSIPLTSLTSGFRNETKFAYCGGLGNYQLSASFKTGMSPTPQGAKALGNDFGEVVLKSAPYAFRVEKLR